MADFSELSIQGRVATESDSDWDDARRAWNLVADQRPAAVALVESADDVAKVVRYARDRHADGPGDGGADQWAARQMADAMTTWAAEGGYFNYAERACDVDAILPARTCERLGQVKGDWDPDGRVLANHSLALATA